MTSPSAIDHAATSGGIPRERASSPVDQIGARLADPRDWARIRLLADLLALYLASAGAVFADPRIENVASNRWLAAVFPLFVVAMLRARQSAADRLRDSLLGTFANVLGVVSLAAMLVISAESVLAGAHPLGLAPRLWLFGVVYLGGARAVLLSARQHALSRQAFATPTLIVGAGVIGALLVQRLASEPSYGLLPVGFLDADPLPRPDHPGTRTVPVLGGPDDLAQAIEMTGARHVILAFSSEPDHILVAKTRQCQELGVGVSLVPRLYESINERATLDHVGGLPLLNLHPVDPRGWQFAVKHALDRSAALFALVMLSPLMVAIAIGVRLSSPGPVLFRSRRVGRDGHEFTMLKFRSMRGHPVVEGEADASWAAAIRGPSARPELSDSSALFPADRVTSFGRFLRTCSLDELPQLVNVLRGDMSLVGPRPERAAYVRDFERFVYRYTDRHRVKSGLTGWAQVHGLRGETSLADRIEWDNYYIQNWSIRLDLRIIFLTIAELLKFRG